MRINKIRIDEIKVRYGIGERFPTLLLPPTGIVRNDVEWLLKRIKELEVQNNESKM